MPVVIDMTGVSTEGPQPLDAGTYPAVISKAEVNPSKNSGENTLYLEFAVGEEGRNMRWSTSLQAQSLWRFKRMLVNLGIEIPEGEFEFDEADLIGIECQVEVIQEQHYKDKKRKTNRITSVLGPNGEDADGDNWG